MRVVGVGNSEFEFCGRCLDFFSESSGVGGVEYCGVGYKSALAQDRTECFGLEAFELFPVS